jgi:rhamnose transport system permease protein
MNTLKRLIRPEQIRELSLVLIIVLAILFFGTQIENYYTPRTFNRIAFSVAIIMVVAVGQMLVVLTRNIDLSVGSVVAFSAYYIGQQLTNNKELAPVAAVLLAIGVGALLGSVNGVLIAYGRIPSIVATLGTLAIYRGMLVDYSGARTITTSNLPQWVIDFPRAVLFNIGELDIRIMVALALAAVLIFQQVLSYTAYGRRLYAIGSNPEAARVAGMPTRRIVAIAYVLCGALSGLAGFMLLARFGNITVVVAQGLELDVVAAVVVGGVNLFGGSGTMIGAMFGAILIGTLEQSLIRMRISEFWKDALLGLFILLAVATDAVVLNRLRNLWARGEMSIRSTDDAEHQEGVHA